VQEIQQLVGNSSWTVPFSTYITSDELPPGQSLEVATVSERLCGAGFVNASGQVNVALLQDISEFTFVNISTYYYVDVLKATEAQAASTFRVSETGLRCSVSSSRLLNLIRMSWRCADVTSASSAHASTLNLTAYDCVDLQLKVSVFRAASLVDFGAVTGLGNMYQEGYLRNQGWAVVRPALVLHVCRESKSELVSKLHKLVLMCTLCCAVKAHYHQLCGWSSSSDLPEKDAYCAKRVFQLHPAGNFFSAAYSSVMSHKGQCGSICINMAQLLLQVFSSDLLCCTVEDQSLVLSLMSLLLANETYLITIRVDNSTSYDQLPAASGNYSYAANFTLTASSSTYYPVASLETVCSLSQNVHAIRNMSMRLACWKAFACEYACSCTLISLRHACMLALQGTCHHPRAEWCTSHATDCCQDLHTLSVDASWVLQAVQAVLADGTDSMFSQQMLNPAVLNSSVDAVAYASNFQPFAGDSFAEQVADYVDANTDTDKVPLGVSVGVSLVGAAILAATAALAFHALRHKRQNRQQKVSKLAQFSY